MLEAGLPPGRRRRGGGEGREYLTSFGVEVSHWRFETLNLCRTTTTQKTNKQTKSEVTIPSHFYYSLFRTNEKMNAVLFLSHLLAIAIEKINVRVRLLLKTWSTNKFHQTNKVHRSGNTLFLFIILIDSPKVIYPVYERVDKRGQKPYPVPLGHIREQPRRGRRVRRGASSRTSFFYY